MNEQDILNDLLFEWRNLRHLAPKWYEDRRSTARAYWFVRRHPEAARELIYEVKQRVLDDHICY